MNFMQVLTIAAGVCLGLIAFALIAGLIALAALIFGLIGEHKNSERRIREEAAKRKI